MKLQLFIFGVFFILLSSTSLTSPSFLINSGLTLSLTTEESFQQLLPPISGNITAVNNNYTVGINDNILVSLAFINPNSRDETIFQDGIHYISVVCPIRSPAIVLPVSNFTNFDVENSDRNLTKLVDGVVFCRTSNTSEINSTKSINEQLLDANLASLVNNSISSGRI